MGIIKLFTANRFLLYDRIIRAKTSFDDVMCVFIYIWFINICSAEIGSMSFSTDCVDQDQTEQNIQSDFESLRVDFLFFLFFNHF